MQVMLRKLKILMLIIFVALFACKNNQDKLSSTPLSEIIKDIAKENVLMGPMVGIAGVRPRQWERYETMQSKATDKELLELTNDTNKVVRSYAFHALAERGTTDLFPIVLQHLSDTAQV